MTSTSTSTSLQSQASGHTSASTWARIRSSSFPDSSTARDLVTACVSGNVHSIEPIRNLGYSLLAVTNHDSELVLRIGARADTDDVSPPADGPFGVARWEPTGQQREHDLSNLLVQHGVPAVPSLAVFHIDEFDVMVMPRFTATSSDLLTAAQWHRALSPMWRVPASLPVFTASAKILRRIDALRDQDSAEALAAVFRERLDTFFSAATRWGTIHGDAHGGNAFNINGEAVLHDFDTSCHGPLAWDLTHLLARAGAGANAGFTVKEILSAFDVGDFLTSEEVAAAVAVRDVAREVARLSREQESRGSA